MDTEYLLSSYPFIFKVLPATFCIFLGFFSLGLYFRKTNKLINYWIFFGTVPSLVWNFNRISEWFAEVFSSLGKDSFYIYGPMFLKLRYLILKTSFNNFPKGEDFREVFFILGDRIFNVDSDRWKMQRKMAHTGFVVEEQLVPFLAHVVEQGFNIDLQDVCSRFAFDITVSVIFGRYENYLSIELLSHELAVAVEDAQETILYRHTRPVFFWKLMHIFGIGTKRKLKKAHIKSDKILKDYIIQNRKDLLAGVKTYDLLSTYMEVVEDKTNEMLNFYVVGRDTVTSGLIWFFWLISKHLLSKQISWKRKETGNTRKFPCIFGSDDLKGLVYLHAALCESLRLYLPVPFNRKYVVEKDQLPDGSTVTHGIKIILSFYSPERWIAENEKLITKPISKYFPFNIGPRTCVGKYISFTLMKSVVAAVLFNFHVEVVKGQHVFPKPYINLHMKNGLKVNIKKRTI
ncbi:hypothetical protein MKX01_005961 [Papaver californicum]|nr:hypothetical protein MKX01_005961 [Papaver californicum]